MTAYTFRATFEDGTHVDVETQSFVSAIYASIDWRKRNRGSAFASELPIGMIRKPILPNITMDAFALRHHSAQMAKLLRREPVSDDELDPTHPMQPDNDPALRAETDAYNRDIARREHAQREADRRTADRIDGYDRDDLGESPDY